MTITVVADENIPALAHYLGADMNILTFQGRRLEPGLLHGADVLLVRSVTQVNRALLADTGVRFVGTATSGFDHIERAYLDAAGIPFAHAPGSNANSVVEYVLAAIAADGTRLETLLQGGTVGIVGYGHVGRALAGRMQGLGIATLCYDPWLEHSPEAGADLRDVLRCDVVSLHCELTTQLPWPSHHLIAVEALRHMRSDSLLINASRGSVVDNNALLRSLGEGYAPAAVLDVWEGEPDINAALLARLLYGTAHIAGYSLDGKVLATRMICQAMAESLGIGLRDVASPLLLLDSLKPPPGASGAELLRALISHVYDIRRDDALLRGAILGAGRVEARENFDNLRRHYGERRELAGRCVIASGLTAADRALVEGLGCVPEDGPL